MNLKALLVTRGNKGMSLFLKGGKVHHIPISGKDDVTDVTGAGDTVCAAVALSLASGADFLDAAKIANYAAGIVVMKRGTATVTLEELRKSIYEWGQNMRAIGSRRSVRSVRRKTWIGVNTRIMKVYR